MPPGNVLPSAAATFMASLLITGGEDVDENAIVQVMKMDLDSVNSLMVDLDGFIDPMMEHMAVEVHQQITRIDRSHELALFLTIGLVLLGLIIFTRILTRPVNLLTEGTKAIVHGEYDFRPRVTGQERLSKVWMVLGCSKLKTPEYSQNKIPKKFYDNQEFYSKEKDRV